MKRSEYVAREDRKRQLISLAMTMIIYLFLLAGLWMWGRFVRQELTLNQGPVLIRLGEPEGAEEPPPAQETPEPETPPEKDPAKPSEPVPDPPTAEAPRETPETIPAKPIEEKTVEPPVEEKTRAPAKEAAPAPPEPIQGSDKGNNYELTSLGGDIGRNLWVPIAQYMPLPRTILSLPDPGGSGDLVSLLDLVIEDEFGFNSAEDNRNILLRFYDKKRSNLELREPVPLDSRPEIWAILERAGYNLARAEYKDNRTLLPVTINFTVEPPGSSRANVLTQVELIKSSGFDDIDEAVLYAFQQSSYYNGDEKPVKGRFTYRFY